MSFMTRMNSRSISCCGSIQRACRSTRAPSLFPPAHVLAVAIDTFDDHRERNSPLSAGSLRELLDFAVELCNGE